MQPSDKKKDRTNFPLKKLTFCWILKRIFLQSKLQKKKEGTFLRQNEILYSSHTRIIFHFKGQYLFLNVNTCFCIPSVRKKKCVHLSSKKSNSEVSQSQPFVLPTFKLLQSNTDKEQRQKSHKMQIHLHCPKSRTDTEISQPRESPASLNTDHKSVALSHLHGLSLPTSWHLQAASNTSALSRSQVRA